MYKQIKYTIQCLNLVIFVVFLFIVGCGVKRVDAEWSKDVVNIDQIKEINDIPPYRHFVKTDKNEWVLTEDIPKIISEKPCKLKYLPLRYDLGGQIAVKGKLPNGKELSPIIIDSGNGVSPLIFDDVTANQHKLDIWDSNDPRMIYAYTGLPQLKIGNITITNISCLVFKNHQEFQLFGIPIWKQQCILMGLEVLAQFNYIAFDNMNKEVEFSYKDSFSPEDPNNWFFYPMTFQKDIFGDDIRLMVTLPIEGDLVTLELDTGLTSSALVITPKTWNLIRKKVQVKRVRERTMSFYGRGAVHINQITANNLRLGEMVLPEASFSVVKENESCLTDIEPGLLGLKYFRNTVVVLDFEQELMKVKNIDKKRIKEENWIRPLF